MKPLLDVQIAAQATLMSRSIEAMLINPRIWERIDNLSTPEPNSGCVVWLGHVDKDGYAKMTGPRFHYKRVAVSVSRIILSRKLGYLPNKALHKCDVSCCIAEDHLYDGDDKQNVADAIARGRLNTVRNLQGRFTCS